MNKLEQFYIENPTWEERRFQLIKDLAVARFNANVAKGSLSIGSGCSIYVKLADKILAQINPAIAELSQMVAAES